jgi:hypothetical protein
MPHTPRPQPSSPHDGARNPALRRTALTAGIALPALTSLHPALHTDPTALIALKLLRPVHARLD